MNKQLLVCGVSAAVVSIALAGCGSDSKDNASTSSSTSSSASATSTTETTETTAAAPAGPAYTIADYINDEGFVQTQVADGDPGAPVIGLQVPDGWQAATPEDLPPEAYAAIMYTGTAVPDNPPRFVAFLYKVTGAVDPTKIIEYSPGEVVNLNGYEPINPGESAALGGYTGYQVAGVYLNDDGVRTVIAEKTVVIPSPDGDGLYYLQLAGFSSEDEQQILFDTTAQIDEQTTITF